MQLEEGFGYALLFESPDVDWAFGSADRDDATTDPVIAALDEPVNDPKQVGPTADAPPTFGELLLRTTNRPLTRRVLVFVPKFARELFPPDTVGAARGGNRPCATKRRAQMNP